MKVLFETGFGHGKEFHEYNIDVVPGNGDYISIGEHSGYVRSAMWVLVDDDTGKPLEEPYVQVLIR